MFMRYWRISDLVHDELRERVVRLFSEQDLRERVPDWPSAIVVGPT
jgi:hypothetical protein